MENLKPGDMVRILRGEMAGAVGKVNFVGAVMASVRFPLGGTRSIYIPNHGISWERV